MQRSLRSDKNASRIQFVLSFVSWHLPIFIFVFLNIFCFIIIIFYDFLWHRKKQAFGFRYSAPFPEQPRPRMERGGFSGDVSAVPGPLMKTWQVEKHFSSQTSQTKSKENSPNWSLRVSLRCLVKSFFFSTGTTENVNILNFVFFYIFRYDLIEFLLASAGLDMRIIIR